MRRARCQTEAPVGIVDCHGGLWCPETTRWTHVTGRRRCFIQASAMAPMASRRQAPREAPPSERGSDCEEQASERREWLATRLTPWNSATAGVWLGRVTAGAGSSARAGLSARAAASSTRRRFAASP
jgi:hypothetical protein